MKRIVIAAIAVLSLAGCGYSYSVEPADHAGPKNHRCFVVERKHQKFWNASYESLGTFCVRQPR